MNITPIQVIEIFRLTGLIVGDSMNSIDADIAIMRAYLDVKMKKLENTMMHQVGYLQCNYGYPQASFDLKKPAYYDKMIERYNKL